MLTDRQIIQRLYDTGHFWSPRALSVTNVAAADLDRLTLTDAVCIEALASFQDFMREDLDSLAFRFHHRMLIADGAVGPATREQLEMPRCGCPDYADPAKAVGSGSWPMPCQKNGVKVHFDTSRMPSALVTRWEKIKADVLSIYADVGCLLIEVKSRDQANIQVWWTGLAGSTIGIAEFNNETCGDVVTCRLDTSYTGYVASLLAHELGHNCNLQHRNQRGIMHPSIQPDPVPFTWRNDPSFQDLVRNFGGEPIAPAPGPAPVPTPVPGDPWHGSEVIVRRVGEPERRFVSVPLN